MPDLSDKVSELAACPFCGGKATVSHPSRCLHYGGLAACTRGAERRDATSRRGRFRPTFCIPPGKSLDRGGRNLRGYARCRPNTAEVSKP